MGRLQNAYTGCLECGGKTMKSGGWIQKAIKHPGRCTPGSPNYDCPKGSPQWNLAQRFKHGDLHKKAQNGMLMTPPNQIAPAAVMQRGGSFNASTGTMDIIPQRPIKVVEPTRPTGLLSGSAPTSGTPISLPEKPAPKRVTSITDITDSDRIKAIDPDLKEANAMLKQANSNLEKERVRDYQRMLNKKYNAGLNDDGIWGKNTQAAYDKYIVSQKQTNKPTMGPPKPGNPMDWSSLPTGKPQGSNSSKMWEEYIKNNPRNTRGQMLANFQGKQVDSILASKAQAAKPSNPIVTKAAAKPVLKPTSVSATSDTRRLPHTGIVVDRGTNETIVLGKNKAYSYPVLTGMNPDKNANRNDYSLEQIEKIGTKAKVTPTGYYIMDEDNISDDDKKEYNGNIRHLQPITAYNTPKPKSKVVAMHQTYNPEYRNQFYSKGPNARRQSYGCVNGKCGDISKTFRDINNKDTVLVIDSRLPKDKALYTKAKSRIK